MRQTALSTSELTLISLMLLLFVVLAAAMTLDWVDLPLPPLSLATLLP